MICVFLESQEEIYFLTQNMFYSLFGMLVCICYVWYVYSFLSISCVVTRSVSVTPLTLMNNVCLVPIFLTLLISLPVSLPSYAVIAYGCASCPKLTCEREGCQTEFCYHCKQIWHPNQTCDMARQQRAQTLRVRTKHTSGLSYGQESGPGISWHFLIFLFIWYFITWA